MDRTHSIGGNFGADPGKGDDADRWSQHIVALERGKHHPDGLERARITLHDRRDFPGAGCCRRRGQARAPALYQQTAAFRRGQHL